MIPPKHDHDSLGKAAFKSFHQSDNTWDSVSHQTKTIWIEIALAVIKENTKLIIKRASETDIQ